MKKTQTVLSFLKKERGVKAQGKKTKPRNRQGTKHTVTKNPAVKKTGKNTLHLQAATSRGKQESLSKSSVYRTLTPEQMLEAAIENVLSFDSKLRPPNSKEKPGGLIEFPGDESREMIIVGDLHANKRNLKAILQDAGNLYKLERNEAVLVFLGDIAHDERTGHLKEMQSSIQIMDILIHLINKYPDNIIYLLGNHDTLSPQLSKSGILQGELFHRALIEQRGERYADLIQRFFNALPLCVIHQYFCAVHAGPVRGGIGRRELTNINHYPDCRHQLIWNRINEVYSTPSMKEYGLQDLEDLRTALRLPQHIPIIVGHNPMWKWGGDDSIWINILRTHDHVILYSGAQKICPYISVRNSFQYEVKYANLKLKERKFVLDNY